MARRAGERATGGAASACPGAASLQQCASRGAGQGAEEQIGAAAEEASTAGLAGERFADLLDARHSAPYGGQNAGSLWWSLPQPHQNWVEGD